MGSLTPEAGTVLPVPKSLTEGSKIKKVVKPAGSTTFLQEGMSIILLALSEQ